MGDTSQTRAGRNPAAERHPLFRETPGIVALLADEQDFDAMRRYAPFSGMDGHPAYLRLAEELLRTLAARGAHTALALFDPARFEGFCAESGLDPGTPEARARYTAEIAGRGTTVPYDGQPLDQLLPLLVSTAERRAGLDRATTLLATAGDCADCGEDIGRAAYTRATRALAELLEAAGPGTHHLVCSVPAGDTPLTAVLHTGAAREGGPSGIPEEDALHFCSVLAAGIATDSPGGVVMRTEHTERNDQVRGWVLRHAWPRPLTGAEVFTAYCTDPLTGEPVPPEPGVDHLPGILLPEPGDGC
ncbi:hypothetical protein [Streptomyces sp. NPDC048845]|uniref:hypothetical protein n=1 Tax=Streptomyces sp. NPDC048845 TaxID=3155390 RepID=UPI0034228D02